MTTTDTDALTEVVRELIRDKGDRVHEWPDDEAAAYRDNGGFAPGRDAVEAIRVAKGVSAIEKIVAEEVRAASEKAWDDCVDEAAACGWSTGYASRDVRDRNPYRATETGDEHE